MYKFLGASVRPVTFGDFGVYVLYAPNKAEILYQGSRDNCYLWLEMQHNMFSPGDSDIDRFIDNLNEKTESEG